MDEFMSWAGVLAGITRFAVLMLGFGAVSVLWAATVERFCWPRRIRTARGMIVVYENGATFLSDDAIGETYPVVNGAPKRPEYDGMDR